MNRFFTALRLFALACIAVLALALPSLSAHAAPMSPIAARSTSITLYNYTGQTLTLKVASLTSGIWTAKPKQTVGPGGQDPWYSESNGFMTGTGGSVTYTMSNGQFFTITWNNPYSGSNSYQVSGTALGNGGHSLTRYGGSGDNADATFILQGQ